MQRESLRGGKIYSGAYMSGLLQEDASQLIAAVAVSMVGTTQIVHKSPAHSIIASPRQNARLQAKYASRNRHKRCQSSR